MYAWHNSGEILSLSLIVIGHTSLLVFYWSRGRPKEARRSLDDLTNGQPRTPFRAWRLTTTHARFHYGSICDVARIIIYGTCKGKWDVLLMNLNLTYFWQQAVQVMDGIGPTIPISDSSSTRTTEPKWFGSSPIHARRLAWRKVGWFHTT